jgi:hypothetical protein
VREAQSGFANVLFEGAKETARRNRITVQFGSVSANV